MTIDHSEVYAASPDRGERPSWARRLLVELGPHDWLVLGYLLILNSVLLTVPPSPERTLNQARFALVLALFIAVAGVVRSGLTARRPAAALLYRVTALGCVEGTYFLFADYLPLVNTRALDTELYDLDLSLFGVEPAMALDRFVSPTTTEWFAFFYFGYFFVLAMHVIPILFLSRRPEQLGRFAMGMVIVFCVGHTLYVAVPGYGPYKAMPELFQHPLPPGLWWNITTELVAQSGAQMDIFPSLHTAAPTFILLFSFSQRHTYPFRYSWPVVAFFWVNIVIATLFLRWHYVIDVLAGMLLALTAHVAGARIVRWDLLRRQALGLGPLWPEWRGPRASTAR